MRTYGEGFIIADQAPGLLDMAVIRNTNTKIIMRLPDESDRQLVGKAAGLNDDQIVELAKLDTGVAAVYQNHWLEPVLCKVERFTGQSRFRPRPQLEPEHSDQMDALFLRILHGVDDSRELKKEDVDDLKVWVERLNIGRNAKKTLLDVLESRDDLDEAQKGYVLYCTCRGDLMIEQTKSIADPAVVQKIADQRIMDSMQVSAGVAEEMRRKIFQYAAEQVKTDTAQFRDLLYYGGVK